METVGGMHARPPAPGDCLVFGSSGYCSVLVVRKVQPAAAVNTVNDNTAAVLQSILPSSETNNCWKDPRHSLQEALSWEPVQQLLLMNDDDDDGVRRILQFLRQQFQEECSSQSPPHADRVTQLAKLVDQTLRLAPNNND